MHQNGNEYENYFVIMRTLNINLFYFLNAQKNIEQLTQSDK